MLIRRISGRRPASIHRALTDRCHFDMLMEKRLLRLRHIEAESQLGTTVLRHHELDSA
jgi:hypothetical protein